MFHCGHQFRTFASAAMVMLTATSAAFSAEGLKFNRDVLPILSENCFFCHGPDAGRREAELRLDVREVAVRKKAIVPNVSEASELVQRIYSTQVDELMPPAQSHRSLTEAQKGLLVEWIEQGAEYEPHWSLIPVAQSEALGGASGMENPIDTVVFHELSRAGVRPQAEAERTTLLRRVYFDLIGLPPTPEAVQSFLKDTSAGAYERVVDELLSQSEYGERMAVHWLDLARYADSNGFQTDKNRVVWAWKEWVIDAFNHNLPYDDFVTYQLAGDLLPDATREQRLATAFNRLHQYKTEGGTVLEEYRVESVADRVNTFGTAFLGLTLECARCHDHKYDPISQKEYFQFFAFFDDIDELGVASHFGTAVPTPALALPSPDTEQQLSELSSKTAILLRTLLKAKQEIGAETLKAWYRTTEEPHMGLDSAVAFNLREAGSSEDGRGRFFDGDSIAQTELGAVTRHDPFSISFWMRAEAHKERVILCHLSDHWTDAASRGWELAALDGKLRFSMIHFWPGNAMSIETNQAIAEQEWTHVALSYDGSSQASGMRLYVNGVVSETRVVRDQLTKQITYKDFGNDTQGVSGVRWGGRARDHGFKNGRIADASFFEHVLHPFEVAALFDPSRLDGFSGRAFNRLSSVELSYLKHLYALKQSPVVSQYEIALRDARAAYGDLQDDVPEILTMRETDAPKQAYLLERGLYSERGAEVFPETPASLPPMKPDLPKNRLGLAQWLLEPENPLFARVAVNRFWALCFGNGLVETAEDFGLQGDQPHYPDLLDQLAREFRKSEWNVKALMRQIVTSKTYRQRSIAAPELMHDDPANRLLARGPSHRLPGEMIRDSALAASGLLLKASHAAPRRPYDLSEAFVPMEVSEGAGLYHRSVYSLWKRSAPSPVMMAFDGVKRDVCSARRITTNTPLQSLVLLNGPQFVEAARVASEVVMKDVQGDSIDLIQQLSLRFISREPQGEEMRILQQLYREQLRHFKQNPEAAEALLNVGNAAHTQTVSLAQHAAAVVLAQTLMNFDEAVMKR